MRPTPDDDRARRPHRLLRAGLPHAGSGPGGGRPVEGDGGDPAAVRPGRTRRPSASAATACWPAGWWSAASASCSSTAAPAAKWDAHSDIEGNHAQHCRESDQPIAGLLKDLKRRGLLDSTLVIWGGEFGRTPMSESGNGRDHNPYGFTMWMAGGGVKGGITHGATDEIGLYAVESRPHVHDMHATILHLLGLDHKELTFLHDGRDERLTMTSGQVIEEIIA